MAQAASQIKKRAIVDTSVEDEKLKKRKIRQAQRQLKKKVQEKERRGEDRERKRRRGGEEEEGLS